MHGRNEDDATTKGRLRCRFLIALGACLIVSVATFQASLFTFANTLTTSTLAWAGLVCLTLCSVSGWFLQRSLNHRLSQRQANLAHAIEKALEKGGFATRFENESNDDLGKLTDTLNRLFKRFDHLSGSLIVDKQRLDSMVEDKTTALEQLAKKLEGTAEALKNANKATYISEQQRQEAETRTKAKSQFVANMSHELRTPMYSIRSMLRLVNDTALNQQQSHYVKTAYQSALVINELLNDILDLSKIEEKQLSLDCSEFNLQKAVESVLGLTGEASLAKGVELAAFRLNNTPSIVRGDPVRFKQIIFNVLGAAINLTPRGYVQLGYQLLESIDSHIRFRFEVSGTLVDFPAPTTTGTFNIPSQNQAGTKTQHRAYALGLELCRNLAQMMHGDMGVEHTETGSPKIWFELAFGIVKQASHQAHTPSRYAKALVFDASPVAVSHLTQLLKPWGVSVQMAETLQVLEELLKQEHDYDVAFISLRTKDFKHACQLIKTSHVKNRVDLIFTGSHADCREAQALTRMPTEHFLSKPFCSDPLERLLSEPEDSPGPTPDIGDYMPYSSTSLGTRMSITQSHEYDDTQTLDAYDAVTLVNARNHNTHGSLHTKNILLIDNNLVNQTILTRQLEKSGCQVIMADNVDLAIQKILDQPIDLVLIDCQTSGSEGYKAIKHIRAQTAGMPELPLIAMTKHPIHEDKEKYRQAGVNDLLNQPLRDTQLRHILEKWLPV